MHGTQEQEEGDTAAAPASVESSGAPRRGRSTRRGGAGGPTKNLLGTLEEEAEEGEDAALPLGGQASPAVDLATSEVEEESSEEEDMDEHEEEVSGKRVGMGGQSL